MPDELMLQIGAVSAGWSRGGGARALAVGLLAGLPRKNCWTLAEHAGDVTPGGMQHVLSRAS